MRNTKIKHFSIETYFIWFSALIFVTELIVDFCLVTYYFHQNQLQWGWIMLALIIVPLILCQIYSLCLLRTADVNIIHATALLCHLFLLSIPYRYQNILRKLDKEKIGKSSLQDIQERIHDVNSIQMLNAVCQYFPQFLFQAFLIVYRKYKCVITGVSAGLAAFSFLWHIFIHFYFCFKCNQQNDCMTYDQYDLNAGTRIIDNLSTNDSSNNGTHNIVSSLSTATTTTSQTQQNSITTIASITPSSNQQQHQTSDTLTKKLKNFEKPLYNTNDKNFVYASMHKNVEKNNIFSFNKRKPIYERDDFDFSNGRIANSSTIDTSTIFFEINDDSNISTTAAGSATLDSGKFYSSLSSNNTSNNINAKDIDNFINENNFNLTKSFNKYGTSNRKMIVNDNYDHSYVDDEDDDDDDLKCHKNIGIVNNAATANNLTQENRNTILKRKGICSSQEMLHLVDIMNDHITPEQVDILAKSLIELGGCNDSLLPYTDESEHNNSLSSTTTTAAAGDNAKSLLFDQFPFIDDKLLENIDAAIYENQIIFQERIRKNQLTIQNLKLQDQMLSKCMMMMSNGCGATGGVSNGCGIDDLMKTSTSSIVPPSCTELLSIRDYENMCFTNISRQNYGMKHWRNYLNNIDGNTHDNSTLQHSSFYVNTNTLSNSLTDLYINEIDDDDDDDKSTTIIDNITNNKKTVRWQQNNDEQLSDIAIIDDDDDDEQLYTTADGSSSSSLPEKNILVQTINKINDSPLKNV